MCICGFVFGCVHVCLQDSQTIPIEYKWLPIFSEEVWTSCDSLENRGQNVALNQRVRVTDTESFQLMLSSEIRLVNIISTDTREKASLQKKSFFFFSSLWWKVSTNANLQLAFWPMWWAMYFSWKEYTLKTTPNQQPLFSIDKHQSLAILPPAGQDDWHPKSIPGSNMHLYSHFSIFKGIICAGYGSKNVMTNQSSIDEREVLLTRRGHRMNWPTWPSWLLATRRAYSISLDPLSFDPWPQAMLPPCELSPPGINSSR